MIPTDCAVVILAGGRARRLGGIDKAMVDIDGLALLDRMLVEIPLGCSVVIAGPARQVAREVQFVVDEPADGGPASGLCSALRQVRAESVVLLAGDMPHGGRLVDPLASALADLPEDVDGVVAVDDAGRRQWLASAWRASALRQVCADMGDATGRAMRELVAGLVVQDMCWADATDLLDVDTPDDLGRARGARGGGDGI